MPSTSPDAARSAGLAFLIYDSRSGSTLLSSLLNAHPEIFVSLEAEYILFAARHLRDAGRPPETDELKEMIRRDRRLAEWDLDAEAIFTALREKGTVPVADFTRSLLTRACEIHAPADASAPCGTPRWLILKQGLLTRLLPWLAPVFPEAPVIHIYRDGRAVYASKTMARNVDLKRPMSTDPVESAWRWVNIQRAVRTDTGGLRIHHIAYESLLRSPESEWRSLCDFLSVHAPPLEGLDLSAYAKRIPGSQKSIHTLVGAAPDPARLNAWKRRLSASEVWTYERIAGKTLAEFGYQPVFRQFSSAADFLRIRVQRRVSAAISGLRRPLSANQPAKPTGQKGPLRIGYLLRTFPQLSETFVCNEIRELQKQGCRISIAAMHRPGDGVHESLADLAGAAAYWNDIDKGRIPEILSAHVRRFFAAPARYCRAMRRWVPDLGLVRTVKAALWANAFAAAGTGHIHTHFAWEQVDLIRFIHDMTGIPWSVTLHAADIFSEIYRLPEAAAEAAFIATISEFNRNHLETHFGIDPTRIRIIRCGIDLSAFAGAADPFSGPASSSPGSSADSSGGGAAVRILSIGRMVEKKGFADLIAALDILKGEGLDFHAKLIGAGPLEESLRRQIADAGLEDRISLPGAMPHRGIVREIRSCDIFALACREGKSGDMDGIPVVLMEAMAAGRPVVSTRISGIPELVTPDCGFLVDPGDAAGLAAAVRIYAADPASAAAAGKMGRKRVREAFSIQGQAEGLREAMHLRVPAITG